MKRQTQANLNQKTTNLNGINSVRIAEKSESGKSEFYTIDPNAITDFVNNDKSIIIKFESKYYHIDHNDIAYVFQKDNHNFLVTNYGMQIHIFISIWELYVLLNSKQFELIIPDLLVNINALKSVELDVNEKLTILLEPDLGMTFYYSI